MADLPPPALGGNATETTLDQANIAMRAMPWYQDLLRSFGQNPNAVKLTKNQQQQVVKQAQAHGFVIDEGDMHVDESGNIDKKGHALRNTLIVAGLAGATLATMGAAGAFAGAGAAGAGAGGAGAAGAGGVLGSTTIGTGALGGIAGGTGLAGTGTAAGLAGAGAGAGAAAGGTAAGGGLLSAAGRLVSGGQGARGYLDTAGQIGGLLGAASAGRAAGRVDEANLAASQNRAALDQYRTELDARRDALARPGIRAGTSVRGDILANAQDAHIDTPSTIPRFTVNGGLRPSMFSDTTRALGRDMSTQALAGQQAHDDLLPLPKMIEAPQAGKLDSILNTAGVVGSLASAIPYQHPRRIPVPGEPDYVPPTPQRR